MARRGFTLVEMLVVIAIILMLFALGVAFLPGAYQDKDVRRGAELLQRWLVMARERAKRDKIPVGIRLLNPTFSTYVDKLQFIMRPDDFSSGTVSGTGTAVTTSQAITNVTAGDFLELNGNGLPHRITAAGGNSLTLSSPLLYPISAQNPCKHFRIIRQPRPLAGELELELPNNVGIDTTLCSTSGTGPTSPWPINDILFAPNGAVTGAGVGYDKIIFYVRNTQTTATKGSPLLVTIYTRTGFIVTHPVDPDGSNRYSFTLDPRSSGM